MSLKACIPNEWKYRLTTETSILQISNSLIKQVARKKHKNKFLYNYQFKDEDEPDIPAHLK